jgi:cystathionine beta-synthase
MIDQGYLELPRTGDLRDLLTRRYEEGALITVSPDDPLLTAFQRMRVADVSQVPVIEHGKPVGILDESDVLFAVHADESRFRQPVLRAMTSRLETVPVSAPLSTVLGVLDRGLVALVMDGDQFLGLITRSDLLAHLRRRLK